MSCQFLEFFFAIPLTILFAAIFSVATGVGGSWWTIFARSIIMAIAFLKFSDDPPNSVSVDDTITFLIMMYSTCSGPFLRGHDCIVVLDFGPRKNIDQLCFVPLVLKCRMHQNKYGESFHFFCILFLHLGAPCCNLKIELFVLRF